MELIALLQTFFPDEPGAGPGKRLNKSTVVIERLKPRIVDMSDDQSILKALDGNFSP
jgi:hypothetical protein